MNGDGKEHREEIGHSGAATYRWLVRNDFPDEPELQTLCRSCNVAKGNRHRATQRAVA